MILTAISIALYGRIFTRLDNFLFCVISERESIFHQNGTLIGGERVKARSFLFIKEKLNIVTRGGEFCV